MWNFLSSLISITSTTGIADNMGLSWILVIWDPAHEQWSCGFVLIQFTIYHVIAVTRSSFRHMIFIMSSFFSDLEFSATFSMSPVFSTAIVFTSLYWQLGVLAPRATSGKCTDSHKMAHNYEIYGWKYKKHEKHYSIFYSFQSSNCEYNTGTHVDVQLCSSSHCWCRISWISRFKNKHAIDLIHESPNAPVPYPQKCAHLCCEWCIVGYRTGALWDLWNCPIVNYYYKYNLYLSLHEVCRCPGACLVPGHLQPPWGLSSI